MKIKQIQNNEFVMEYGDEGVYFYFILIGGVEVKIPDQHNIKRFR